MNNTISASGSLSGVITETDSISAFPTGAPGGGGMGGSPNMTDQRKFIHQIYEPIVSSYNSVTFLRGGYPTNSEGMVEFQSVYPGYCEYMCPNLMLSDVL